MFNKAFTLTFMTVILAGCSTHSVGPISAGKNSYVISKQLSSFSSQEGDLLSSIFSQAQATCNKESHYMKVEQLNEYIGLIGNESKTTLIFSCIEDKKVEITPEPKVKVPAKISVKKAKSEKVEKQTFPNKSKLTNFAF